MFCMRYNTFFNGGFMTIKIYFTLKCWIFEYYYFSCQQRLWTEDLLLYNSKKDEKLLIFLDEELTDYYKFN